MDALVDDVPVKTGKPEDGSILRYRDGGRLARTVTMTISVDLWTTISGRLRIIRAGLEDDPDGYADSVLDWLNGLDQLAIREGDQIAAAALGAAAFEEMVEGFDI